MYTLALAILLAATGADADRGPSSRRRRSAPPPAPPPPGFPSCHAAKPDAAKPLGGYPKLQQLSKAEVLHGGKQPLPGSDAGPIGSYNHNVSEIHPSSYPRTF